MSDDIITPGQHGGGGGVCYELLMATVTYQGGHVLSSLSSRYKYNSPKQLSTDLDPSELGGQT